MSPAPRRNILPGNCSTCRKTTGSCGLVSGPQGEKKKKKNLLWLYPPFTTLHHVYGAVQERKAASLHLEMQLPAWKWASDASLALALALKGGKQHTAR